MGWLIRLIWKLYPREFRERFSEEMVQDLELRRGGRRPVGLPAVGDALLTLVRSWTAALVDLTKKLSLWTHVRMSARTIRRAPGYSFAVVAILALALGANTAVFSVTHSVLLKALPYRSVEQLYAIRPVPLVYSPVSGWSGADDLTSLPQVEAAAIYIQGGSADLVIEGQTKRVSVAQVTPGFFQVLGVSPRLGPGFGPRPEAAAVISYRLWTGVFNSDPDIIGTTIQLSGTSYPVAGVLPVEVAFPGATDIWLPFPPDPALYGGAFQPIGIGRTARGADLVAMRSQLWDLLATRFPAGDASPPPVTLRPLRDELTGTIRRPIMVLMGISALLVVLGCLNLAGLVVARTSHRRNELTIRRALGAGTSQLFTQLLTEVMLLALVAGSAGLLTASVTTEVLQSILPAETTGLSQATLEGPVLGFAAALTVLSGLLVGAVPSLRGALARTRLVGSDRTATSDRGSTRLHVGLVVGQVALAFVLVTGAALLSRSLLELNRVPVGYDLESVLTFDVRLPPEAYPSRESRGAYLTNALAALRAMPDVTVAGATTYLPGSQGAGVGLGLTPGGNPTDEPVYATWVMATAGYFEAMEIPAVAGSPFSGASPAAWGRVAISRSLSARLFPTGEAVGRSAQLFTPYQSQPRSTTVEAVVGDVRLLDRRQAPPPIVYTRLDQSPSPYLSFAVRTTRAPTELAARVRDIMLDIDPSVQPYRITTTGATASAQIATETALARLSGLFSGIALLLALFGLYGLVAQSLAGRQRELGIHLALGAQPRRVLAGAVRKPLGYTAVGVLIGLMLAIPTTSALSPLLFEVSTRDPSLIAAITLVLLAVAAMTAYLPARRVLRIDPTKSLKTD